MNESDGKVSGIGSNMKQSLVAMQVKASLLDKNIDLMQLFKRKHKQYGWYFEEQDAIRKRFTPKKQALEFDEVFMMD